MLDSDRDVDGDGATDYAESAGPLSGPEWWAGYSNTTRCSKDYVETPYPGPKFKGLSFVDPDSDGDGIRDGDDDIDHDGLTNKEEGRLHPTDWCDVYVSVGPFPVAHAGTDNGKTPDPKARIDPFNQCKPFNSDACHKFVPNNYYVKTDTYTEDWKGPPPPSP